MNNVFATGGDGFTVLPRPGALPADEERRGLGSAGILKKGDWVDVKVTIQGGASPGLTAGMLVEVEELTPDLERARLFHTAVSRAIASWSTRRGEPGFGGLDGLVPHRVACEVEVVEEEAADRGERLGDSAGPVSRGYAVEHEALPVE